MHKITCFFLLLMSFKVLSQTEYKPLTWEVKSTQWSRQDEERFQEFIKNIGRAREQRKCFTTESCLKSSFANPAYSKLTNPQVKIFADCADLPYVLRAYFAWMNDLPFSYPISLKKVNPELDKEKDIRYTAYGNEVIRRKRVVSGDNINTVLKNIANFISTAVYRIPTTKDVSGPNVYNDFFPVKINRKALIPGTVFYDPNGHILVVYEVTKDGRVFMIDAHPDNSLTRAVYDDKKFVISSPSYGAGFKNWRTFNVEESGSVIATKNNELTDEYFYSTEQYLGHTDLINNNWRTRKYLFNGSEVPFGEYVRQSLAVGNLRYDPLKEFKELLKAVCDDVRDRKDSVDSALAANIHLLPHPERLPQNIYGTTGLWETYSTPSRDARLKAAFWNIKESLKTFITKHREGDPGIDYQGQDLSGDLLKIYDQETRSCKITYTNSAKVQVGLTLDDIINRIYNMSFDPYHCVEQRWGAIGDELSSCRQEEIKNQWYEAEQLLRNTIERNYDLRMNYTVYELPNANIGTKTPMDLNIKKLIEAF